MKYKIETATAFIILIILLYAALFTRFAIAQEPLEVIVEPNERITNKLFFLLDKSGSMDGIKINEAISSLNQIINIPTDDIHVAVSIFGETYKRWSGTPDGEKPGWTLLPSADNLAALQAWINNESPGGDNTKLTDALNNALIDPMDNITIVIVSDGNIHESYDHLLRTLASGQEERKKVGLKPVILTCLGVGAQTSELLTRFAQMGNGGYFHRRVYDRK